MNEPSSDIHWPKTRKLREGAKITLKPDQWLTWVSKIRPNDFSSLSIESAEKSWAFLQGLPKVRGISLSGLTSTGQGLTHASPSALMLSQLDSLHELEALKLFLVALPREALESLASHPTLDRLEVAGDQYLPDGLRGLRAATRLHELRVMFATIQSDDFASIAAARSLDVVNMYNVKPADGADRNLLWGAVSGLRRITLGDSPVLDAVSLRHIGKMRELQTLEIEKDTTLTDQDIAHIAGHPTLERVSIAMCTRLTDAALDVLSSLPRLRSLSAYGVANFTDQGILALGSSTTLAEVSFGKGKETPYITQAGVDALVSATAGRLKVAGGA